MAPVKRKRHRRWWDTIWRSITQKKLCYSPGNLHCNTSLTTTCCSRGRRVSSVKTLHGCYRTTGSTCSSQERTQLSVPRPPAARYSLLSDSTPNSQLRVSDSATPSSCFGVTPASGKARQAPSAARDEGGRNRCLLLSSRIPGTCQRGNLTAMQGAFTERRDSPSASSCLQPQSGANPRSCQRGTRNANSSHRGLPSHCVIYACP